ncbi:hypothetical protein [Haladaptatus sp. R4]|nr:hypothetical protein [Haladaptatus sp. R4]
MTRTLSTTTTVKTDRSHPVSTRVSMPEDDVNRPHDRRTASHRRQRDE